ncbi:MAG: cbb3-type cytochrome c oxidase subunit 3 [Gammaproteobacteria bacterium]|nr:cbb3-type cytochrome c oxidase subunit 3 [Gammaproteobacteria bacterium]MBU0882898.1 cbb3-type cytochrome c oxidase subunit 3 [Gammaproteobacteria bacterium]MBU0900997.1 cbb3-type cytochrome c oxidase subunit 3 [Gammaproteobacteria bacterium]MBU1859971.1 cbb3-type cytochrome c oxidase subunit 3 [Gammaproteobacteria bacterium]
MSPDIWGLTVLVLFYLGVHACLARSSPRDLDEAAMLPFADDPEVARRVERQTGRSTTGCSCPGRCNNSCEHTGRQAF